MGPSEFGALLSTAACKTARSDAREASPTESDHLLSAYYVLDVLLVCASHLIFKQLYEVGMSRVSFWMRKP